ncbi:MAG: hypothetical protein QE269_13450 [Fimbriimonas sp.]|jgi:hypothetical protein|nr:hypothetical protein [Fimbriimonas sp.]
MAIQWKVRTTEVTPQRTTVIIAVILVCTFVGFLLRIPLLAFLALGFFSPILFEYFAGKKCEVSEAGATAGFSTITWDKVKSVKVEENAVQLSPFESESKLDATRGVRLVFDETVEREQVMEIIRTHLGKDVRFLGG